MKKRITAGAVAIAALVVPAAASAQNLHIIGQHLSWLIPAEKAVSHQQPAVQAQWRTPGIRWTTNGWPVYIGTIAQLKKWHAYRPSVSGALGYHSATVSWTGRKWIYHPFVVVNMTTTKQDSNSGVQPSEVLDHETLETLVDPTTQRYIKGNEVEICDPVYTDWYKGLGGVQLTDFVYPSYFHNRSYGPYDYLHVLNRGIGAVQTNAPDVVPARLPNPTGVFR